MTAHKFTASTADKTKCAECGKTRNAKAHKVPMWTEPAVPMRAVEDEVDTGMTEDEADAATAEAEIAAEEWGIPPVPPFQPSADDVEAILDDVEARADEQAEADAEDREVNSQAQGADDARKDLAAEALRAAREDLAAPAKEVLKSHWAAAKLVAAAIEAGGALGAKFDAAKASKTGSRSVRLTRAECDALAAIATDVETKAVTAGEGRLAHSARTLRERLAASWA